MYNLTQFHSYPHLFEQRCFSDWWCFEVLIHAGVGYLPFYSLSRLPGCCFILLKSSCSMYSIYNCHIPSTYNLYVGGSIPYAYFHFANQWSESHICSMVINAYSIHPSLFQPFPTKIYCLHSETWILGTVQDTIWVARNVRYYSFRIWCT